MNDTEWRESVEWVGVVAGCLVEKDGRYLLVQEKQPKVYGLWNLPAGHVDKGETIQQAAVREAKEESGYDVELGGQIGLFHEDVGRPVKHIYQAHVTGGELQIQESEILDAKWLSFEEIRRLQSSGKLRAEWIWEVIQQAQS